MGSQQRQVASQKDHFVFQGPGKFNGTEDLTALMIYSHKFFFARKFATDVSDPTRLKVIENYRQDNYKLMMKPFMTDKMILWVSFNSLSINVG